MAALVAAPAAMAAAGHDLVLGRYFAQNTAIYPLMMGMLIWLARVAARLRASREEMADSAVLAERVRIDDELAISLGAELERLVAAGQRAARAAADDPAAAERELRALTGTGCRHEVPAESTAWPAAGGTPADARRRAGAGHRGGPAVCDQRHSQRDPSSRYVWLAVLSAAMIFGLQLRHSLALAREERPRGGVWTLLALAALVYVPLHWLGINWFAEQNVMLASVPMVLGGWLAAVAIAGACAYIGIEWSGVFPGYPGPPLSPTTCTTTFYTATGIGTRLSLSPTTVRNYLSSAIGKVGGHNRIDAIRIARENGWL